MANKLSHRQQGSGRAHAVAARLCLATLCGANLHCSGQAYIVPKDALPDLHCSWRPQRGAPPRAAPTLSGAPRRPTPAAPLQTRHPSRPGACSASPAGLPPLQRHTESKCAALERMLGCSGGAAGSCAAAGGTGGRWQQQRQRQAARQGGSSMRPPARLTAGPLLLRVGIPGLEQHCLVAIKVAQHGGLDLRLTRQHSMPQSRAASEGWRRRRSTARGAQTVSWRDAQQDALPVWHGCCVPTRLCTDVRNLLAHGGIRPGPRTQLRPAHSCSGAEARVLPHAPAAGEEWADRTAEAQRQAPVGHSAQRMGPRSCGHRRAASAGTMPQE